MLDIFSTTGELIFESPCKGCGRVELHKRCPAHGTLFYCSGIPFSKTDQDLAKISPSLCDHLFKAKWKQTETYQPYVKQCNAGSMKESIDNILNMGGIIVCVHNQSSKIVYLFSEEINE